MTDVRPLPRSGADLLPTYHDTVPEPVRPPALDWRSRPLLFHPHACLTCCTHRVRRKEDSPPFHPDPCPNCGWNTRAVDLCRFCGRTAHFEDDAGRPVHKTCLDEDIARRTHGGDAERRGEP